ncbi:hypothetical protein GCM10007989_23030 [Devosia pacifica]|uniref:Phytase-like domain-containing protein n=1 Tax=Devosia pacifica TaxID=1335967 RepID=A0A918S842_9HYPH|nr:esterase-like activity of phytase family protein [Devosia pacifica]GHA26625.1 hypothetical protein GCM10007989_23030 [Devosia pacifica]
MNRGALRAVSLAALAVAGIGSTSEATEDFVVRTSPLTYFAGRTPGEAVGDGLIWRGGLNLTSDNDRFGGLSGLSFVDTSAMIFVSDRGQFFTARIAYDESGRPAELLDTALTTMENSNGEPLPRQYSRDAESVDVVVREGTPVAVRVGFEHLTRAADFDLDGMSPAGAARNIAIPEWLSSARSNETLESLCIAPPASPVAGSTLMLSENLRTNGGQVRAWMMGVRDRGDLAYETSGNMVPTDCAFLPDGDLLVLERGLGFLSFAMRLVRIPADLVRPGAVMRGAVLLEAGGGDIDNMEALGVHVGPDGETRVTIASDDNFNDWQRTILLEFALVDGP